MNRKWLWVGIVVLVIITTSIGFWIARTPSDRSVERPAVTTEGPKTILRVALFRAPASEALNSFKAEFEKQFNATVEIEMLPYAELQAKIEQQFLTNSANYDVIMVDCILIPAYATRGMLAEVDPAVWKGEDLQLSDIMPALDDTCHAFLRTASATVCRL